MCLVIHPPSTKKLEENIIFLSLKLVNDYVNQCWEIISRRHQPSSRLYLRTQGDMKTQFYHIFHCRQIELSTNFPTDVGAFTDDMIYIPCTSICCQMDLNMVCGTIDSTEFTVFLCCDGSKNVTI